MPDSFHARLVGLLRQNMYPVLSGNVDAVRHAELLTATGRLRERVTVAMARLAKALGYCDLREVWWGALTGISARSQDYERAYARLADEESRKLLVFLMAYRILGHRRVRLPVAQRYEDALHRAGEAVVSSSRTRKDALIGVLNEFDLAPLGYPVGLQCHRTDIAHTWILEQYHLQRPPHEIAAMEGEIVIDCGGCWGDTALYFAHRVGPSGLVVSYEFDPGNVEIYRHNLGLNDRLAGRIRLIERAVWSDDVTTMKYKSNSVATALSTGNDDGAQDGSVLTDSIDAMVEREGLSRVDFIKMDIEGAEMNALEGARQTIARHRPKLAISAYHRPDDMWQLSAFVESLGLGYRFYLDHFTVYEGESVLFCEAPRQ